MGKWEIMVIAFGLAMDAFSAAVCRGLAVRSLRVRDAVTVGAWFGIFQGLMPLIGYFLGIRFAGLIVKVDHWIAFFLLALIGGNMIREAGRGDNGEGVTSAKQEKPFAPRVLFPLALATSIDALAIGVTFAFLGTSILPSSLLIAAVTFLLSTIGMAIGHLCGSRFRAGTERVGGIVLILIGLHILLEHLGVWSLLCDIWFRR